MTARKEEPNAREDRCETCRFWARDPNAHGNTKIFDCRRHAPMFHGVYRTHWCQTRNIDWCGEYQRREC